MMAKAADPRPVILVTGGTGQVGHELQRELAPLGRVHAPRRAELDLADPDSIRAVVRAVDPRLIVNAGAHTNVDRAEFEASECRTVNAIAPGVLGEEAARCGAGLVHYSTDYVFDGAKTTAYHEDDTPNPVGVYGQTKLEGELAVMASTSAHLVLRVSWVYGLRGRNFLNTVLRLAREDRQPRIVADQFGAPTWSRMVAVTTGAIISRLGGVTSQLADVMRERGGLFHLASPDTASWHDFADMILQLDPRPGDRRWSSAQRITTAEYPTPARRPRNSVLDAARAARTFGLALPPWRIQLALALAELAEAPAPAPARPVTTA